MALFPTGLNDSQESMFEASTTFPGLISDPVPALHPASEASLETVPAPTHDYVPEPEHVQVTASSGAPEPQSRQSLEVAQAETEEHLDQALQTDHPDQPDSPEEADQTLTVDDFAALEDRVLKAVSLVRRERQARAAAEQRVTTLEAELMQRTPILEKLQQEVDALRIEREQVRQRVERLLSQLDSLEL